MEQFFDTLFRPSRAVESSNKYSLFTAPIIWLVILPLLFRASQELSEIGIRISFARLSVIALIFIFAYVVSVASLYRLLLGGSNTLQYSVVLSFLPYVFVVFSLFAGDYAILVIILLAAWSALIELLAIRKNTAKEFVRTVTTAGVFKAARVAVFIWLTSGWWSA